MTEKVFTKEEWLGTLETLKESYKLFGPVKDGDFHTFMPLDGNKKPDFDYENTRLSPKSVIYPESERMFEYSLDESEEDAHILKESPKDYSPCAVLGIRPCDAQAFQIVKRNFDNPEYQDPWWTQHFEATTLVGLGCNTPCATCFCTQVGGDPFHEAGLDVLLFDLGDRFLAKAITEKGEALLEKTAGNPADDGALAAAEALKQPARDKITATVPTDQLKEKVTTELFDAPFWEEVAFAALLAVRSFERGTNHARTLGGELLLRLAGTLQIRDAIAKYGVKNGENYLVVFGPRDRAEETLKELKLKELPVSDCDSEKSKEFFEKAALVEVL